MVNNRYNLLLLSEGCDSEMDSVKGDQQTEGGEEYKKESDIRRNKIIILRDSHASGCAQEVQHILGHDYVVQGLVKPGANMETIVNTLSADTNNLTKKDTVVVCGGTRDVGTNEIGKGLQQIKNFVETHKQTNTIVMSALHRHDLEAKSCVNDAVKEFNRKLKKHLKQADNACVIEVDPNRNLFTRHGLHMNWKGKEQMARIIARTIKNVLTNDKRNPIKMKDRENAEMKDEGSMRTATSLETETGQENLDEEIQPNNSKPSQENISCNAPELGVSNALSKEEGISEDTLGLPSPKASEHYIRSDDEDTKCIMTKTDAIHSPHDGKDKEEETNVMPLVDLVRKSNRIKNPPFVKQSDFLWST